MSDYRLKTMMEKPERLARDIVCVPAVVQQSLYVPYFVLCMRDDHAVIGNATGCLEVSSFMYPYTAWEDSYIHNAFENAGATLSGVETAYRALKKRGRASGRRDI